MFSGTYLEQVFRLKPGIYVLSLSCWQPIIDLDKEKKKNFDIVLL